MCCSEVSISPLFRWPNSVNHFRKIVIDGRYMIDSHEGNYRLYRIEGGTPSVIGIYQRPSSAIVDVIADSIRITHRHADTEDTVLEIQRLATVCRDTLNGMTK
ncbi:hypothetical protein [Escherichia coli]